VKEWIANSLFASGSEGGQTQAIYVCWGVITEDSGGKREPCRGDKARFCGHCEEQLVPHGGHPWLFKRQSSQCLVIEETRSVRMTLCWG
jgi:hypothetical protein